MLPSSCKVIHSPAQSMCVDSEGKSLQDLKPTIAAFILDGVFGLARRDSEVGSIVDHACGKRSGLGAHVQSHTRRIPYWSLLQIMYLQCN